jgi:hypothetical protein
MVVISARPRRWTTRRGETCGPRATAWPRPLARRGARVGPAAGVRQRRVLAALHSPGVADAESDAGSGADADAAGALAFCARAATALRTTGTQFMACSRPKRRVTARSRTAESATVGDTFSNLETGGRLTRRIHSRGAGALDLVDAFTLAGCSSSTPSRSAHEARRDGSSTAAPLPPTAARPRFTSLPPSRTVPASPIVLWVTRLRALGPADGLTGALHETATQKEAPSVPIRAPDTDGNRGTPARDISASLLVCPLLA